jgi:hypothetical protein
MGFQVLIDQGFQQITASGREIAALDQEFAQGLRFGEHPSLHRADEAVPADEVHLEGQNAEEKVPVRSVR